MTPRDALPREALEAVLAPLARARTFPRAAYTEPAVLALELAEVFARGWYAAGAEADVPAPGAWTRVPLLDEALVLARGADLIVRALRDVCSHRAALLLEGDAGRLPRLELVCPYHRWSYDLAGSLRAAPGLAHEACDRASLALATHPVATRLGQHFVALGAKPDEEPPLPPWLARLAGTNTPLRRAHVARWETRANWKLVVENFQEAHHFPTIHPGLERRTAARESASVVRDDAGWLGGVMPLRDDSETVSLSGRVGSRVRLCAPSDARTVYDALVFPTLLTSLQPDYLLVYRLHPRAADRTAVHFEVYLHAASPDDPAALDDVVAFWSRTNAEDRAICERQQRALAATATRAGPYATSEDGVHAFDQRVARRLYEALYGEAAGAAC